MTRKIIYILIACFFSFEVAGADTTVVRDLSHDWYFYDNNSDSYFPLVSKSAFRGKTIHFDVKPDDFENCILNVASDQAISLFINNQMISLVEGEQYFVLDSLKDIAGAEKWHFTIYHKRLDPFDLSVRMLKMNPAVDKPLAENPIIIRAREIHPFHNFAITAFVLLGAFLAALYNYFPRILSDFFKVTKAFALRESDENLFKSRPLSQINLLIYLYLSLLIALVLMLIIYHSGIHVEAGVFNPDGYWASLWKWLQLALLVMLWLVVKYLLINNMSSLFKLGNFMVSHFFNYIRMTLLIFMIALVIVVLSYFGFGIFSPGYYNSLFDILLIFLGLRVIILFFKLLSSASYKTLHLFSYLCGTEVIPFGILLYLGLNQPF